MHSDDLRARIEQLESLFQSLDQASESFLKTTKIGCKPGCGACCIKPDAVWATVGEMLPIAWKLYRDGQLVSSQVELDRFSDDATCILFAATELKSGLGRCSQYAGRPSICRLFGSSIRMSKNNVAEVITCTWQRTAFIKELNDAEQPRLAEQSPVANDWTWRVKALFPEAHLSEEFPINRALREAFLIVSQTLSYEDF